SRAMTGVPQELSTPLQRQQLAELARRRRWGLSLLLIGWLHLLAFSLCYYLTVARGYHEAPGYLAVWLGELCGAGLIFRLCGGPGDVRQRAADGGLPVARLPDLRPGLVGRPQRHRPGPAVATGWLDRCEGLGSGIRGSLRRGAGESRSPASGGPARS